jgi:hypothetical protein
MSRFLVKQALLSWPHWLNIAIAIKHPEGVFVEKNKGAAIGKR